MDAFAVRARSTVAAGEPEWLRSRRAEARLRFDSTGFPTLKDEDWKYTNVAAIAKTAWGTAGPVASAPVREAIRALALHLHGGITLVLVDGVFTPNLCTLPSNVLGLSIGSLADAIRRTPDAVEPNLGKIAVGPGRPFVDLSTALLLDGLFVHVARGTCLPVPIDVLHVTTQSGIGVFPRTLVVAEAESRITLVEHHVRLQTGSPPASPTDTAYLTVPVVEVALARNAAVEHVLWQDDADTAFHVACVEARQAKDSRFASHVLTLGAALARTDVNVTLEGEGAECTLDGLYLVFGDRHADHHTKIDHAAPHGTSRELYKGILDGRATGVFNGKVLVRPGAMKTDSKQSNHNLLLSPDATANTKPELEIYADDVKCAHGATVGRLDADKLFYLRSRGLSEQAARDLLLRAFARDVTERISIEAVRARLDRWMTTHLPALAGRDDTSTTELPAASRAAGRPTS
jgi:Fe-S cluster assembly protein SufD